MDHRQIEARIVPKPRNLCFTGKSELVPGDDFAYRLTVPGALEDGPAQEAVIRLERLLREKGGHPAAEGLAVSLERGTAPAEMQNPGEGYAIDLSGEGIRLTGYGDTGLLYAVVSLKQLFAGGDIALPALSVLDWPDCPCRGWKLECRYSSDMMEEQDWYDMLEDALEKKVNMIEPGIYGCWSVQYDGRVSEYLYVPIKSHPELKTPKCIKYFSARTGKWVSDEKLPPIFEKDYLSRVVAYGKRLGMEIFPQWNSFGHNTLLPNLIPEISSKNENGEPERVGFCTSNPKTYEVLFGIYDEIYERYMKPYGITSFNTAMDEVSAGIAENAEDIFRKRDPWCRCEKCRGREKGDIFIDHFVKIARYWKAKGIRTLIMASDMIQGTRTKALGDITEKFAEAIKKEGLEDIVTLNWWSYSDIPEKIKFTSMGNGLGLRSRFAPWNGYYCWNTVYFPLKNAEYLAHMNKRDGGEGVIAYNAYDKSYDRVHDAISEYVWDCDGTGDTTKVTERYALRHFPSRAKEAYHALRLMDFMVEERKEGGTYGTPRADAPVHPVQLINWTLSYYFYSYVKAGAPYPRNFPGEGLEILLSRREDYERALRSTRAMALEASGIFRELQEDAACDRDAAKRMYYECQNYLALAEDWLALLEMHDLSLQGRDKEIAPIARARKEARLSLIALCEDTKEHYHCESLTCRNLTIFMEMFKGIEEYVERTAEPKVDLLDAGYMMTERFWWLR